MTTVLPLATQLAMETRLAPQLYARREGSAIILRTSRHLATEHEIVLTPERFEALMQYARRERWLT